MIDVLDKYKVQIHQLTPNVIVEQVHMGVDDL